LFLPTYSFLTTESRKRFEGAQFKMIRLKYGIKKFIYAVFSSVAYLVARGLRNIMRLDVEGRFYVSGGWSNNKVLLSLIASFIGREVYVRSGKSFSTLYGLVPFILGDLSYDPSEVINHLRPLEMVIEPMDLPSVSDYISAMDNYFEEIIK